MACAAGSTRYVDFLIVGAGPAGLSAALEARRGGIEELVVLEKGPSHSQMIRTFYKEGKRVDARYAGQEALCFGLLCLRDGNRETYLSFMDHVIEDNKIPTRYNVEVWSVQKDAATGLFTVKTSTGEDYQAKVVVVAIGKMGKPKSPDYWREVPNDLKHSGALLFEINSRPLEGKKILVIGGGDSACEYAQILAPHSDVTLSYRRASIERANPTNRELTQDLIQNRKIRALLPSNVRAIANAEGKASVEFQETEIGIEIFDHVIYGLGGMTPHEFMRTAGLAVNDGGEPVVSDIKESSVHGLFIVGDLLGKLRGGGSIISGFNSSSAAIRAVLERDFGKALAPAQVSLDHLAY